MDQQHDNTTSDATPVHAVILSQRDLQHWQGEISQFFDSVFGELRDLIADLDSGNVSPATGSKQDGVPAASVFADYFGSLSADGKPPQERGPDPQVDEAERRLHELKTLLASKLHETQPRSAGRPDGGRDENEGGFAT